MAIDYGNYASTYAGNTGNQGAQQLGAGFASLLSRIPNRKQKMQEFATEWWNKQFTGLQGGWEMNADGGLGYVGMTPNPEYDWAYAQATNKPIEPSRDTYDTDEAYTAAQEKYTKDKAQWDMKASLFKPQPGMLFYDKDVAYKKYRQAMIDEFGEKRATKSGLLDPVEFSNMFGQMEQAQSLKMNQELKAFKYANPEDWDNDSIYRSLEAQPELYAMLNKYGYMASDPDLAGITPDATIYDYLPEMDTFWKDVKAGKLKVIPPVVGTAIAGYLGYKFIGGKFINNMGQTLSTPGVMNKLKALGANHPIMRSLVAWWAIPGIAQGIASGAGAEDPQWWGNAAFNTALSGQLTYQGAKYATQNIPGLSKTVSKSKLPKSVVKGLTKGKLPGKMGTLLNLAMLAYGLWPSGDEQ